MPPTAGGGSGDGAPPVGGSRRGLQARPPPAGLARRSPPPGRHRGGRSIDPGRPAPARAPGPRPTAGPAGWPETSRSHPGCRVVVPERGLPAGSGSDIRGAPGAGIGRARARVDRAEGAPRGRAAPAERACRAGAGRPERAPPPRAERSARPARSGSPRAAPSGPRHGRGSAGRTSLVPDLAGQGASRAPTRDTGCGRGHSGVPPVVRVAEPLTAARPPAHVAAAP